MLNEFTENNLRGPVNPVHPVKSSGSGGECLAEREIIMCSLFLLRPIFVGFVSFAVKNRRPRDADLFEVQAGDFFVQFLRLPGRR
jgi:hypothetical protein